MSEWPRAPWSLGERIIDLITPDELATISDGWVLVSIRGEDKIVGHDYIDGDTRGGFLAVGWERK
jgi:hypothetical protein